MRPGAVALAALASLAAVVGCGGSSSDPASTGQTSTAGAFAGLTANPPKPAPPLKLNNSLGQPVNLADYRGKAVLVTFIYDHCPDICPTIVSNFRAAQNEMSPEERKQAQFIAVSVDPEGDTPQTVKAFLKDHLMTGRMQYLIGSRPELESVWAKWGVTSRSDPSRKNPDAVEHSAQIYGVSASGKITTLYPSNFKPQQIVHDVPKLAAS
jgi:protein SCO1/2